MHALPRQNNINLHREKLLQISVLSLKGEELQRSLPPRESARSGECRWRQGEPITKPSARSMSDHRDLNRHSASAVAGPEREITGTDTLLGACLAGAKCIAVGKNTISPSFFLERAECVWAPLPKHVFLYFVLINSQYVCANIKLCQISSTSSPSPSSEEERRSDKPFLRGEEPRGGLPIPENRCWIWWENKKIGARPSSFPPSDPSAIPTSTATAPPRQKWGRHREERWWKLPPQREFSGSKVYAVEALTMWEVGPLESRLCMLHSESDHAQTVCIPARLM